MLRIGLTGGIASGKSVISDALARRGYPVIDADIISRELMQPGAPGYQACIDHFGQSILDPQGLIDRAALRQKVFNDPKQRHWLEAMLHPLIRERIEERLAALDAELAFVIVPLLFESGFDRLVDRTLAIDCPREVQLQRLMQRDGIDRELANRMLDAQLSNDERLQRASLHIRNDGSLDANELADRVIALLTDKSLASP
jgi:dephospho-CoA kinase